MDEGTILVLAVQLTALCSIAGSLLLYLICKARTVYDVGSSVVNGKSVLVTSCENSLGLQLSLHLASIGFRVFAGVKQEDSDAAKVLKAKLKLPSDSPATLVVIPLDVTREDSLHEAVDEIRRHLPAGEHGLQAVFNTTGIVVKGRLEFQESFLWDSMFKVNVVGALRTARAFLPLLKPTRGRLITIGLSGECQQGTGVVAYSAARHAVAGASAALSNELAPYGVSVITINTGTITADALYYGVKIRRNSKDPDTDPYANYRVSSLPRFALSIIEKAVLTVNPKLSYDLVPPPTINNYINYFSQKITPFNKTTQTITV